MARATLQSSDLCRGLDESAIDQVLNIGKVIHFAAQELIFSQGQKADAVYLPCSGSQLVERSANTGQRQVLAFLRQGDYLGLNTSDQFLYSAHTLEPSHMLRFASHDFYDLASGLPVLRDNVGRISNQVLARALDHLFAIGQKRAHERLAFLLWQLWSRQAASGRSDKITLSMRRTDIGDYLGLTLETTSRAFSRLRSDAVIATQGRNLVQILDESALCALADVK
ncbi:MAG: Crp/Fnr family transcriptional regulator [Congregibacter sp.]